MNAVTRHLAAQLPATPSAMSWAAAGAIVAGGIGAIAGLIIGLIGYPPTAWFAVFELGIPAGIVGGLVGFVAGGLTRPRDRPGASP